MSKKANGRVLAGVEGRIERVIFGGRWILAPLYIGLTVTLLVIVWQFLNSLVHLIQILPEADAHEVTLGILELLDHTLLANLILMVIFAGYENFVSRIGIAEDSQDRPQWMGHVDYSGMKVKLIGSLVAISVIQLLYDFMNANSQTDFEPIAWRIGIHLTFVLSGVLFAVMDLLADKRSALAIENKSASRR